MVPELLRLLSADPVCEVIPLVPVLPVHQHAPSRFLVGAGARAFARFKRLVGAHAWRVSGAISEKSLNWVGSVRTQRRSGSVS